MPHAWLRTPSPSFGNSPWVTESDYIIYPELGEVMARNGRTGAVDFWGTDSSEVIQDAMEQLTLGGRVHILGRHTITKSLEIPYDSIILSGNGVSDSPLFGGTTLSLADGVNAPVLKCKDDLLKQFIELRSILFDGNSNEQTAAQPTVKLCVHDSHLDHVLVLYSRGACLELFRDADGLVSSVVDMVNCMFEDALGPGLDMKYYCNNIWADHCFFFDVTEGVLMDGGADNEFIGCVSGQNSLNGYNIQRATRVKWIGGSIYSNGRHGILGQGLSRSKIMGSDLWLNSAELANAYDGIRLQSYATTHSIRNIVNGVMVHGESRQRYGLVEADANQDYNVFTGNILTGNLSGNLRVRGLHTEHGHNSME